MSELISIILPVFNVENYIEECLNSIIRQTYTNLEILLIDDGSKDNSGKICDEFAEKDARIRVIHKENGGVSSARNLGLELAQGEYVSFIDSDDFVDKEYISAMYGKIKETASDLVFCKLKTYDDTSKKTTEVKEDLPELLTVDVNGEAFADFICRFFNFKNHIFGSCCRLLFKKQLTNDVRFNTGISISEDLLFVMNLLLKANTITSIDRYLYFYRQAYTSVTNSYRQNYLNKQIILYEDLKIFFSLFKQKKCQKTFQIYSCLLCRHVILNELKFKKHNKSTMRDIRNSALYKYFKLKNGLQFYGIKRKLSFLVVWFCDKTRLV